MLPGPTRALVAQALAEDVRSGDITSQLTLQPDWEARAAVRSRASGVLAGGALIAMVYDELLPGGVQVDVRLVDGSRLRRSTVIAEVSGPARVVLAGERVMLNFLQRLSGIATLTAKYVAAVHGTRARIADTRKTTPGLRALEKAAVVAGGGVNHRFGLDDAVMIKDNHVELFAAHHGTDRVEAVAACVRAARVGAGHTMRIVAEVEDVAEAEAAAEAGADVLLLDNFESAALRACVNRMRKHGPQVVLEASGGITLRTVGQVAATGVDIISVGALTHSPPALDIALDVA